MVLSFHLAQIPVAIFFGIAICLEIFKILINVFVCQSSLSEDVVFHWILVFVDFHQSLCLLLQAYFRQFDLQAILFQFFNLLFNFLHFNLNIESSYIFSRNCAEIVWVFYLFN